MKKSTKLLREPPGVLLYADKLLPILTRCSLEDVGRFTLAALEYRRDGVTPNFDGSSLLDIAWDLSKPTFDRDRLKHIETQLKGLHGVYVRETNKENKNPLSFEMWLIEEYVPMMGTYDPLVDSYVKETLSVTVTEILKETESVTQEELLSQKVAGEEKEAEVQRVEEKGNYSHEEMRHLIMAFEPDRRR